MRMIQQRVTKFLKKYSMDYQSVHITEQAEKFVKEMKRGLAGEGGSLRMIPTFLGPTNQLKIGKPVIVLDAGGTNFRVAVVSFDENYIPHIEDCHVCSMPGTKVEIGRDEFFRQIAQLVLPVADRSDTIAFCFSYACEPTPDCDGIIVEMGKQIMVKGLIGEKLGDGLNAALHEAGCTQKKRIVVLNDSVATLLGGVIAAKERQYDGYIGFILGTGLNASYVEKIEHIPKISGSRCVGNELIVNTESGDYDGFPCGYLDNKYDSTLIDPKTWRYEKMVSGRYQGGMALVVLRQAADDGLFSCEFKNKIQAVKDLSSLQLDEFLYQPNGENVLARCCLGAESVDAVTAFFIIDALAERAAKLVAANLAALMIQMKSGKNPLRPVCITADGSTFYKSRLFRKKLDYYMKQSLGGELGLYCEFNRVEDVNLTGTAVAGLSI